MALEMERSTSIRRYDFRQPNKFSREQLKILKTIFENWGKAAAPQLSAVLRLGVEVGEVTAEEILYSDFYQSLDESVVGVIDPDHLPGAFLIALHSDSALAIYDRLLGSSKSWDGQSRDLTEIESETIEMIVSQLVESEFSAAWEPIRNLSFKIENFGPASNFIGVVPLTESTVVIDVPLLADGLNLALSFCLPYAGLEPLVAKLNTQEYFNRRLRSLYREQTFAKRLPDIPVEMVARLATIPISYADATHLRVGDQIALPRDYREAMEVYVDEEQLKKRRASDRDQ